MHIYKIRILCLISLSQELLGQVVTVNIDNKQYRQYIDLDNLSNSISWSSWQLHKILTSNISRHIFNTYGCKDSRRQHFSKSNHQIRARYIIQKWANMW